jgi:hypothetical protein
MVSNLLGTAGIGGAIGKAIVQLELDTKKYQAELASAEGKTVASTSKLGAGFSKFGSLASSAMLGIGAAAVVGLGLSVKAALEAQEAHQRLLNTVRNSAELSASSVKAFEDQAEAIRSVTGADDEAVISGQALLGQMGLTEDAILKLTPLTVDLASKFDIDLNTAFKAVGKAAAGNTGSLARYVGAVEKGATPAETLSNVLDKLGASAGYAAEQAKNQPWLLLKSDMEEISEEIGAALLPALRSMADLLHEAIPLIEALAKSIQYLPLFQMAEGVGSTDDALHKLLNGLIDTVPVLGHYVDLTNSVTSSLGPATAALYEHTGVIARMSEFYRDKLSPAVVDTRKQVVQFANKTSAEIKEWSDKTKESFDSFIFSLEESATATVITRKEFIHATNVMQREAEMLNQALKRISKEKWVNDEYIAFLSEQGPEWLIGFGNLTESQQRRAQEAWENTTHKTDAAKNSLDKITGALGDIAGQTSKGTVEIHYKYVGFDPSKPGMATAGSVGGQQ